MDLATRHPVFKFALACLSVHASMVAGSADLSPATQAVAVRESATTFNAVGDGKFLNTAAIQRGIDTLFQNGGGTLVIPKGVFVTGALFFKPGVHLYLEKDAVLRCSTDVARDFPAQRTRLEGRMHDAYTPALINADGCHGLGSVAKAPSTATVGRSGIHFGNSATPRLTRATSPTWACRGRDSRSLKIRTMS